MNRTIAIDAAQFKEIVESECPDYKILFHPKTKSITVLETDTDGQHSHVYGRNALDVAYEIGLALGINARHENKIKSFSFRPGTVLIECAV